MIRPINERDEFLLNRLLDDDLSPEEAAGLRIRLEREPELRRAYESLTRIDGLLVARRSDQPNVDWPAFHRQVMNQIEEQAAHRRTIRLADFRRVALPLAAAAAIALLVWFRPQAEQIGPPPEAGKPSPLVVLEPRKNTESTAPRATETRLIVNFQRPDGNDTPNRIHAGRERIHVAYARSDNLFKEYRAMDERNRNRQPWQALFAANVSPARSSSRDLPIEF